MKLVLLRHATRSPYENDGDSLSRAGLAQAEDLITHLAPQGSLPAPTRLLVSPKRRAKETLQPLSEAIQLQLEIDPRLDERHSFESGKVFEERVRSILDDTVENASEDETIYLCSHSDWLEMALMVLPHDLSDLDASYGFSPCEYRVFRRHDGIMKSKMRGHVAPRSGGIS